MDSGKIGAYIQLKRKSAGLTQTQLGDMLGITSKAVSKWETGVAIPDVSLFPELTKILNITIEELLQGEDNKVIPPEKKKRNIIIVLSIILSLITIFLITTIIYFKSNYKKVEIYKLESANKDFYVEGSLTSIDDKSYLSITKVEYLGSEISLLEYVNDFRFSIYYMEKLIYDEFNECDKMSLKRFISSIMISNVVFEKDILDKFRMEINFKSSNDEYKKVYFNLEKQM